MNEIVVSKDELKDGAYDLALEEALRCPLGDDVYELRQGWEATVLKSEPRKIRQVKSLIELEQALENTQVYCILVLKEVGLSGEAVKQIVGRYSSKKTVIVEMSATGE